MAFAMYGKSVSFPRNDHVDIHVRTVTLNADSPSNAVEMIDIREFIKSGEIYGHGLVIPRNEVKDLKVALDRVTAVDRNTDRSR